MYITKICSLSGRERKQRCRQAQSCRQVSMPSGHASALNGQGQMQTDSSACQNILNKLLFLPYPNIARQISKRRKNEKNYYTADKLKKNGFATSACRRYTGTGVVLSCCQHSSLSAANHLAY